MKVDSSAIVLTGGMYHEFSVKEYSNLTGQVKIYKLFEICQSVGLKKNLFLALYLRWHQCHFWTQILQIFDQSDVWTFQDIETKKQKEKIGKKYHESVKDKKTEENKTKSKKMKTHEKCEKTNTQKTKLQKKSHDKKDKKTK